MSLSLKIRVIGGGGVEDTSKTFRLTPNMSVSEVCKQIKEKCAIQGGADRGLFQPAISGKTNARWLKMNRTLQYYDISSGQELQYKKKHRPLKITLVDGTVKTVLIDDSLSVGEIVDVVGKKMGIKNPEEFSLMLNKKWLNSGQALHEQGVEDQEMLTLKKKFFFTDANIDRSDPVQLHLLFCQCKEAIITGTYPTQRNEAKDLAALQCQIEQQDFNASRHKSGTLKLGDILPPEHQKAKDIERDIFSEWRKLVSMTEVNAKFRYVQLCRSLKTYGITSFTVKFKNKKKKWEPLVIGVTRDSIMKMSATNNEVIQQYPLTHLRRWAASGNTFTLDFGDYEDDYFIVQTDEAESISQLIAGYIDIILKSRSDASTLVTDDDSNVADVVTVAPIRALATRSIGISSTTGGRGRTASSAGLGGAGNAISMTGKGAQSIQITDLKSAMRANKMLADELGRPQDFQTTKSNMSPQQLKEQLSAHGNAIQSNADELLNQGLVDPDALNRGNMLKAAKALMASVMQMGASAKMAAAAGQEVDQNLLNSAKAVSDAIASLLKASDDLLGNPHNPGFRDAMTGARDDVLHAGHYLNAAVKGEMTDVASQELLLATSRALAAAIADMVTSSQSAAKTLKDGQQMKSLLNASKSLKKDGDAASNAATALAPAAVSHDARQVVEQLGKHLDSELNKLLATAKRTGLSQAEMDGLLRSAKDVSDAINALMQAAQNAQQNSKHVNADDFDAANNMLVAALAKMKQNMGDRKNVVEATKQIALSSNKLIGASKAVAKSQDAATMQRLLAASKACAEAVTSLVNQAKATASNPSAGNQQQLGVACGTLQQRAQVLHGDAGKIAQFEALRRDAKFSAAASTVMVANAKANAATLSDRQQADALLNAALTTADAIRGLLDSVGYAQHHKGDDAAQLQLLHTAKGTLLPTTQTITECKRSAPKITDRAAKQSLGQACEGAARGIQKLAQSVKKAAALSTTAEVDDALEQFAATSADLDATEFAAQAGLLQRTPGQTAADAAQILAMQAKEFARAQRQMTTTAVDQPAKLGPTAKGVAQQTQELVNATKQVIACTPSRDEQKATIERAKALVAETHDLVSSARSVSAAPGNADMQAMMDASDQRTTAALKALVGNTSGVDTEGVDRAIAAVGQASSRLQPTRSAQNFNQAAEELTSAARIIQAATTQCAGQARTNPKGLSQAAKITASSMPAFVKNANIAMGAAPDQATRDAVMQDSRAVIDNVQGVLETARTRAGNRSPQAESALASSSTQVQASVKQLMKTLGTGGNQACDEAIARILKAVDEMEAGRSHPDQDAVRVVQLCAKQLAASTQAMVASSKKSPDALGASATQAATTVARICNASAIVANPSGTSAANTPSQPPPAAFATPGRTIQRAADTLLDANGNTQQIVNSARTIAQTTAQLVQVAKREAAASTDKAAASNLLKAAQALATATSSTARAAKASAQKQPGADAQLQDACSSLNGAVETLLSAASPKPAALSRDSQQQREAVDPADAARLTSAAHEAATATTTLIGTATNVSIKPSDKTLQTQMGASANAVVNSIRKLLDAASSLSPGVKDCEAAQEVTQNAINQLGSASLAVAVGNLENTAPQGTTHQQHQQAVVRAAQQLQAATAELAAPKSSKAIAQAAKEIAIVVPSLADAACNAACTTKETRAQERIINLSKDLVEAEHELLSSSAAVSAEPKNAGHRERSAKAASQATTAINGLMSVLQAEVDLLRDLDESIAAIRAALPQLDTAPQSGMEYGEAKQKIASTARAVGSSARALVVVDKKNIAQIGNSSKTIAAALPILIEAAKSAAGKTDNAEVQRDVMAHTRSLARACEAIALSAKACAQDSTNAAALTQMTSATKSASETINQLLTAAKKGDVAAFAADECVADVTRNIGQIDASALYAAAGQLEPEEGSDPSFGNAERALSAAATEALNAAKPLPQAASRGTPTNLADAMYKLAGSTNNIVAASKRTAALVDNLDTQQSLLQGAKGALLATTEAINAALMVQQSPGDAEARARGQAADQQLTASINALVNSAKAAAEEQSRGARDLDNAQQTIQKSLNGFAQHGNPNASAEDVVIACRGVAGSSAAIMSACNMSDPAALSAAAQQVADSTVALLENAKGAQKLTDKQIVKSGLEEHSKASGQAILDMLSAARTLTSQKITPETMQKLSDSTNKVAEKIHKVVDVARQLPGAEHLRLEEEGDDLEDLAEQELLKAAQEIDRATARLKNQIKPKASKLQGMDEIDIVGPIIDSAAAITSACAVLVKAAHDAQKERVEAKRDGKAMYRKDPMWANGLISAAQNVVAGVKQLVESANNVLNGDAEEEELIAAAKMVAAATAQLCAASRAKAADPFSSTQQALMKAAKLVADATQRLVEVAKEAQAAKDEEEEELEAASVTAARKREFEKQVEILKLEAQLAKARGQMGKLRSDQYAGDKSAAPAPQRATNAGPRPMPRGRGGMRGRGRGMRGRGGFPRGRGGPV